MGIGTVRTASMAVVLTIASSVVTAEASVMQLVQFEFEGHTNSIEAKVGSRTSSFSYRSLEQHRVAGRFTLNLDAASDPAGSGDYPWALVDFTVTVDFAGGPASADFSPTSTYSGERPLNLFPFGENGVELNPEQGNGLLIESNLTAPFAPLPMQSPSDFGVVHAAMQYMSITASDAAGLLTNSDLTVANVLALADQSIGFWMQGDAAAWSLNDFFVDPNEHWFTAGGQITSLSVVTPVPLPATVWLMLSGIAAVAGAKVWPRLRRA